MSTCKLLSQITLPTRHHLVSIWHMDLETETKIYVSNRILSGFYKAIVYLKIVKVRVHLIPGPTWFLSGVWIQKLKCKTIFLTGSYLDSIRQYSTCKLLSQITFATRPHLVSIWHMYPETETKINVSNRILSGFYKAVVYLQFVMPNYICYSALPGSYLAYGSRNENAKLFFEPDPIRLS